MRASQPFRANKTIMDSIQTKSAVNSSMKFSRPVTSTTKPSLKVNNRGSAKSIGNKHLSKNYSIMNKSMQS